MTFDRKIFFDKIRPLFGGVLTKDQVEGMEAILSIWEEDSPSDDPRHLAYCLATTKHETASTMQPIEEFGKGRGMKYGKPDPNTGQVYYGRGFVQLTWADNYITADSELALDGKESCYLHPDNVLDPEIAAEIMFRGMREGWFRKGNTLSGYFNNFTNDSYGAREIINGDKNKVPSWSDGVSIGGLIAGYHKDFLAALTASWVDEPKEELPPHVTEPLTIRIVITTPPGVVVQLEQVFADAGGS